MTGDGHTFMRRRTHFHAKKGQSGRTFMRSLEGSQKNLKKGLRQGRLTPPCLGLTSELGSSSFGALCLPAYTVRLWAQGFLATMRRWTIWPGIGE